MKKTMITFATFAALIAFSACTSKEKVTTTSVQHSTQQSIEKTYNNYLAQAEKYFQKEDYDGTIDAYELALDEGGEKDTRIKKNLDGVKTLQTALEMKKNDQITEMKQQIQQSNILEDPENIAYDKLKRLSETPETTASSSVSTPATPEKQADSTTWQSMDEAIDFYEQTFTDRTNYERRLWSQTSNSGNTIVLHWSNIGGAGGSYWAFQKNGDGTKSIIVYDGNASYPNNPSVEYVVDQNHQILQQKDLWKDPNEAVVTRDNVFDYLFVFIESDGTDPRSLEYAQPKDAGDGYTIQAKIKGTENRRYFKIMENGMIYELDDAVSDTTIRQQQVTLD